MSLINSRFDRFGIIATVFSLFACYGTIAIIAILGAFGIAIALDETLWAGAIITFASFALGSFGFGLVIHRKPLPILIGGLGVGILAYAMYVQYSRITELSGFIFLCLAAFLDWRIRRRISKSDS